MSEEKMFYTISDIQKMLGISRPTVYRLLKKKEFHWIMVGSKGYRISRKSFDDWLEESMCYNKDIIDSSNNFRQLRDKLSRS